MHKKGITFVLLGLLFLCTGCFEIVEEISFNKDGSGHITLTLNLSQSKTKLNSIMLLDSINDYYVPSEAEIRKQIAEVVNRVKKIEGISNLKNTINLNDFILTFSCDFSDTNSLNSVVSNLSTKKEAAILEQNKHFNFDKSKNTFTRNYPYNISKEFRKTKMEDREVFKTASLTTIYRFKTAIISSKNTNAKISGSRKAIMLNVSAQDIIQNKKSIKNQIKLQP